jgi:hypothetical protein
MVREMRAVVFVLLGAAVPGAAWGDTCKQAFSQSSKLVVDGKLVAAVSELRACAAAECPSAMRSLCVHDLEALEPRLPTVVFAVKDEALHRDVVDVRVFVDGSLLLDGLDGKAHAIDPGFHAVRFERHGDVLSETRVLVREGEKDRLVAAAVREGEVKPPETRRPITLAAWVTGGFAAATAVVWAATGIDGFVKESQLDSCKAMGCPHNEIQSTQTMFNVADIAGGTTLALGALTTVFVLTRPTALSKTASLSWAGTGFVYSGRF